MTTDEKAREIAKGLCASMPCDRHLWCECPSRVTGSTLAKDKANEGVAHCLENLDEIATALAAARREGIEEAAKRLDQQAGHHSELSTRFFKEGRAAKSMAHDAVAEFAGGMASDIRALNEKAPTSGARRRGLSVRASNA